MAFAQQSGGALAGAPDPSGSTALAPPPGAPEEGKPEGGGPAQSSGRLWVPGQ
jgi:hypothetical protein